MKKTSLILIPILLTMIMPLANATGTVTIVAGTILRTKYGQLTAQVTRTYDSIQLLAGSGVIIFDVTGLESANRNYLFHAQSYGNGTWDVLFLGRNPQQVVTLGFQGYSPSVETIAYGSATNGILNVIYTGASIGQEPKRVLFLDDFLTGPSVDSKWVVDQYAASGSTTGIYSQAGYMVMQAKSTSATETAHSVTASFNPSGISNFTQVKRKLTVALYPFQKKESPFTASLQIGLSSLLSTGTFPGTIPQNTPTAGAQNTSCTSAASSDSIGSEYFYVTNSGTVEADACGDPSGTKTSQLIETVDPTLYTVLTIETSAVYCTGCFPDNTFSGSAWVWYRVYQEDAAQNVIASTDMNVNFTDTLSSPFPIAPYFQKLYTFVSQDTTNSAATFQTSYIDLVQLQSYGSPVCLFGCIPPLVIEGLNFFSGLWASLVGFCLWIGNGDLGFGALMLFGLLSAMILGSTYFVMRRVEGASTLALVIEFMALSGVFITSGLMGSIWVFVIITADAIVAFITFRSLFFSGSRGGSVQTA